MTFYDELQLSAAGSRKILASQKKFSGKLIHFFIYLLKVVLTVAFAFLFVTAVSLIFGSDNSSAGVAVLLFILAFQKVDFDVNNKNALLNFLFIFAIFAISPRLSNAAEPILGSAVSFISILALLILGCHKVEYMNHSVILLSYLLLYGYDVTGERYAARLLALAVGAILTILVYTHKHMGFKSARVLKDNFLDFNLKNSRSKWQLITSILIPAAMLIPNLIGLSRTMWIGFAIMSICCPYAEKIFTRAVGRVVGTIGGILLFYLFTLIFPENMLSYFGLIGGTFYGFALNYGVQTMFNVIGALSVAVPLLGIHESFKFRLIFNAYGAFLVLIIFGVYIFLRKLKLRTA